jgi:hypothetical protein
MIIDREVEVWSRVVEEKSGIVPPGKAKRAKIRWIRILLMSLADDDPSIAC